MHQVINLIRVKKYYIQLNRLTKNCNCNESVARTMRNIVLSRLKRGSSSKRLYWRSCNQYDQGLHYIIIQGCVSMVIRNYIAGIDVHRYTMCYIICPQSYVVFIHDLLFYRSFRWLFSSRSITCEKKCNSYTLEYIIFINITL